MRYLHRALQQQKKIKLIGITSIFLMACKRNQFFSKITFTQQKADEQRNSDQLQKFKNESQVRLKRNEFRRTILEIKSKQRSLETSKYAVTDEDLAQPIFQRSPTHLENQIDNQWNHLEMLDKKHLKFIYGPKTFNRQKKAISQIDNNFKADIELQKLKFQAQMDFRNKLLKHNSFQTSKGNAQGLEINFLRQVRPEYKGMLLLNLSSIEQQCCPTLYSHVKKFDSSTSMQTRQKQQSTKNIRSKSFNTQQTEIEEQLSNQKVYDEMNESLQRFEITLKERCQYLES
ncbi:unnamed protein product [Paramecium sonneborni]|uniref:Uncharacterized protein n=1 Tax=Paramecium sonneborni TaxID=65129 RepID=A0A8S1KJE3_9CILI|nr:unnamed protein product [Paramecium sonneborni]